MRKVLYESATEICDFCGAPDPKWSYPCEDFDVMGVGSVGAWDACSRCRDCIDQGGRLSLYKRAITGFGITNERDLLFAREVQRGFFAHKLGPAMPAAENDEPFGKIVYDDGVG